MFYMVDGSEIVFYMQSKVNIYNINQSLRSVLMALHDEGRGIGRAIGRRFHDHTGKCIRRFGGIYAYCRYFIDRKW